MNTCVNRQYGLYIQMVIESSLEHPYLMIVQLLEHLQRWGTHHLLKKSFSPLENTNWKSCLLVY